MEIIPAILANTTTEYHDSIQKYSAFSPIIHIDVNDGSLFGGSITLEIKDILNILQDYSWVTFDLHVMTKDIDNQLQIINDYQKKPLLRYIFIHYKEETDLYTLLEQYNNLALCCVISPGQKMPQYLDPKSALLLMTVKPGAQGQSFDKTNLSLIANNSHKIFLDGAMNINTLTENRQKLETINGICVGSFLKTDTKERYTKLKELLR
jgi:pentose-5-phosphate-3-epimerase